MERKKRWIEIQFYCICTDLLKINNSIVDVLSTVDFIATLGNFSGEQIKILTQELLTTLRYRPDRYEYCTLAHENKVNIKYIKKRLRICNRDLYNILEQDRREPRPVFPKMLNEQHILAEKFINTFKKLQEVGY